MLASAFLTLAALHLQSQNRHYPILSLSREVLVAHFPLITYIIIFPGKNRIHQFFSERRDYIIYKQGIKKFLLPSFFDPTGLYL